MDLIPLPDDIPIPDNPPVTQDGDLTSIDILGPTVLESLMQEEEEVVVNEAMHSLTDTEAEDQSDNSHVDNCDNTVIDMEYQDCMDTVIEDCEPVEHAIRTKESVAILREEPDFSAESNEIITCEADIPIPDEMGQELPTINDDSTLDKACGRLGDGAIGSEIPMPIIYASEQIESNLSRNDNSVGPAATGVDSTVQSNSSSQVQYSSANYMYPSMSDPSMMSHNYSYMTASNYSDYMSMYHAANSIPQSYSNAYTQYSGYNYTYPMQQMYDGTNMTAAYSTGNYSAHMMPSTAIHAGMNNFTPPLPADYSASVYSSKDTASQSNSSIDQRQLQLEKRSGISSDVTDEVQPSVLKKCSEVGEDSSSAVAVNSRKSQDRIIASVLPDKCGKVEAKDSLDNLKKKSHDNNLSEDLNRYSPSLPMDEDDVGNSGDNIESGLLQIRPPQKTSSVLGKAQAKKRLMAFSFSKQTAAAHVAAKKQAHESSTSGSATGAKSGRKENSEMVDSSLEQAEVSVNVLDDKYAKKRQKKSAQKEKARETIEEIEELKRTEMLMSTNALLYRQNLLNEANNMNHADTSRRRSRRRSRSGSGSRSRRHSRSRSRDHKTRRPIRKHRRRSHSRTQSKSGSHSRSGSEPGRKLKVKTSDIKSWDDFREAGFHLDRYRRIKFKENCNYLESEVERKKKESKRRGRSGSKERRSVSIEKEVIESNRKRKMNFLQVPMEIKQPLVITRDSGYQEEIVEFPSKIMQYTNTRPVIRYCENPNHANLHLINRVQFLETVPEDIVAMMKKFWSSIRPKRLKEKLGSLHNTSDNGMDDDSGIPVSDLIHWWSKSSLREDNKNDQRESEEDDDDRKEEFVFSSVPTNVEIDTADERAVLKLLDRTTRVRKSRFEEADNSTGVSVLVRSRWDSDYEASPDESTTKKLPNEIEASCGSSREITVELNYETRGTNRKEFSSQKNEYSPPESIVPIMDREWIEFGSSDDYSNRNRIAKSDVLESHVNQCDISDRETINSSEGAKEENVFVAVPNRGNDCKLVSEYEEFLKMVNFELPKDDVEAPLYEGPKPPPLWNKKTNDVSVELQLPTASNKEAILRDCNPSAANEDEKVGMDMEEENFDIDKFFLEEKEKKMKKLGVQSTTSGSARESSLELPETNDVANGAEQEEKERKNGKNKKKKKKIIWMKTNKHRAKDKKKRKHEKKKRKRKNKSTCDSLNVSTSNSSDSDNETSRDDATISSSNSTTSMSTSWSSLSSSDSDSSKYSSSRMKVRKSKKLKRKDRKRILSGKYKRKKRKQEPLNSDSEDRKKKKSKNRDRKKRKSKKLNSDNIVELLIEKSLALKMNKKLDDEEGSLSNDVCRKKYKKRKKKHEKSDKEKTNLLSLTTPNLPEELKTKLINQNVDSSDTKSSNKSNSASKRKKLKVKKRRKHSFEHSGVEGSSSGWRKKIDPKELEENVTKAQKALFQNEPGAIGRRTSNKTSPSAKKRKKKLKRKRRSENLSREESPNWKKKKIDSHGIEENVTKAERNSFFEVNLDDWDKTSTDEVSVAKYSMRDENSKNEQIEVVKSKKKTRKSKKHKNKKRKLDKNMGKVEKQKHKNSFRKSRKNGAEPLTTQINRVSNEVIHLEDIPLPQNEKPAGSSPEKRNFAMFSKIREDSADDESRRDSSWYDSQCSFAPSNKLTIMSPDAAANRYSPTECEVDEEEETQRSENFKPTNVTPCAEAEDKNTFTTNNTSSNLTMSSVPFTCIAISAQNNSAVDPVALPSMSVPGPVPPPIVLSHNYSRAAPAFTVIKDVTQHAESSSSAYDETKISDKLDDANTICKSFSISKQFRTKAALKFFSSNVFDVLEDVEKSGATQLCSGVASDSITAVGQDEDAKKLECNEDVSILDRPSNTVESPYSSRASRLQDSRPTSPPSPPLKDDKKMTESPKKWKSPEKNRSSSRNRSNKYRDRRDPDDSHDGYRKRSRSRDRYKKYYRRDRYKRRSRSRTRSRSRSRSRTRRRSRERERFRRRRRSYSSDRDVVNRKRSLSFDRSSRRPREPLGPSLDDGNEGSNLENENCRFDVNTAVDHKRRIYEIIKCVREMETSSRKEHELRHDLLQLKNTLHHLSSQGVPLDPLRNVLSILESTEITKGGSEESDRVTYQNIISIWHALQNCLLVIPPPLYETRLDPRINRSPQDVNKNLKLPLMIMPDPSVNNYSTSQKRFETRSREISPKPLSLDERLELELGVKRSVPDVLPITAASASAYYSIPMYENVLNFTAPPPPITNFPPPILTCAPDRGYYQSQPPPPMNWNNRDTTFFRSNGSKLPPPVPVAMPSHHLPPSRIVQQPLEKSLPPAQSVQNSAAPYHVPDVSGSKVHSIQVGNVLQIVPTEVQPSVSSQAKSSPAQVVSSNTIPSKASSNRAPTVNSAALNSVPSLSSVRDFSSLLSAHLPGSFATAPAVSGSKHSVGSNELIIREHRLMPNDPRHKPKDLPPPPPPPPPVSATVTSSEVDVKKLLRLAKEKQKEEKSFQNTIKGKIFHVSPSTPSSDDNHLFEDVSQGYRDESYSSHISIKPSPEQGILVSPGFRDKSTPVTALGRSIIGSTRKMVSFVDGIRPGSAAVVDSPPAKTRRPSPPPSPVSTALPKKKHKVRVKIIRPDDSDDDDGAPPPPPPGPPPPELYPPSLPALGVFPSGYMLPKL